MKAIPCRQLGGPETLELAQLIEVGAGVEQILTFEHGVDDQPDIHQHDRQFDQGKTALGGGLFWPISVTYFVDFCAI